MNMNGTRVPFCVYFHVLIEYMHISMYLLKCVRISV